MLKQLVEQLLPDLGGLEGEYHQFYLQSTVTLYSVTGFFIIAANLAMMAIDSSFFADKPNTLNFIFLLRVLFSVLTAVLILVIRYKPETNRLSLATSAWMFVAILYFLSFNFLRPTSHLTTSVDVMLIFGAYILSGQRIRWLVTMLIGFSLGSIVLVLFYKTDIPDILRLQITMTHVFAQGVGFISALQLQSFRRRAFLAYVQEKHARELAIDLLHTDSLTKSLTRHYFLELAEQEIERAKRYGHPLSVLMMDIDHFKNINDQYCHRVGDEALITFADVVRAQKRQSDIFGRLGGEEFALLLPDTNRDGAAMIASRIQEVWAKTDIRSSALIIPSTVSIGVVECNEVDINFDDLLVRADKAMYLAKQNGRNRVEKL